jgi:hypothetical protein
MRAIVYEPSDIVPRHLRKLFLEDVFQPRQDYGALPRVVIVDNTKFYVAIALFDNRIRWMSESASARNRQLDVVGRPYIP